ncbi:hypothetical protein, partial [Prevotella sp.]|uniref:hypothetical protein n=1 Tax=Prevotella sp. TaxID=59823 RepID=UPI0025EA3D77
SQRTLINEQANCTHEQARMRMSPLAGRPLKILKKTPKFAPKKPFKKPLPVCLFFKHRLLMLYPPSIDLLKIKKLQSF